MKVSYRVRVVRRDDRSDRSRKARYRVFSCEDILERSRHDVCMIETISSGVTTCLKKLKGFYMTRTLVHVTRHGREHEETGLNGETEAKKATKKAANPLCQESGEAALCVITGTNRSY